MTSFSCYPDAEQVAREVADCEPEDLVSFLVELGKRLPTRKHGDEIDDCINSLDDEDAKALDEFRTFLLQPKPPE